VATLIDEIRRAIAADRVLISSHADDMLRERSIMVWQVIAGTHEAVLIREPADVPNPVIEVEQRLADGTPVKVVWAWIRSHSVAKLVTVHFFDR
jgi:hypothetical protein